MHTARVLCLSIHLCVFLTPALIQDYFYLDLQPLATKYFWLN